MASRGLDFDGSKDKRDMESLVHTSVLEDNDLLWTAGTLGRRRLCDVHSESRRCPRDSMKSGTHDKSLHRILFLV